MELSTRNQQSTADYHGYEIVIAGHLDEHWSGWLGRITINHEQDGSTRLVGNIPDQAALHGLLMQIRDLGLTLLSLKRVTR